MSTTSGADPVDQVLSHLPDARELDADHWEARCPAHKDDNPSLSVSRGDDGRALVHCHAGCSQEAVVAALGLTMRDLMPDTVKRKKPLGKIIARYPYKDESGQLLYEVVRYEPKTFRQRRPDGKGDWINNLNGTPRVLYRLPELLAADHDEWVVVVEGEKDVEHLQDIGITATCNPGGAGKWAKLRDDVPLHSCRVAIVPDRDEAGRAHALDVAARLYGRVAELKVVELPGEGVKDAADWIATQDTGLAQEEVGFKLLDLVDAAPAWEPTEPGGATATAPGSWCSGVATVEDADGTPGCLGQRDKATGRLILSTQYTLPTAQAFVEQFHTHPHGRTLHNYAGVLMEWRGNRYVEVEDEALRNRLQPWLANALRLNGRKLVRFPSNNRTIASALEAIRAYTYLPLSATPPVWLGTGSRPHATELMVFRSGILHIPTGQVLRPTPALFNTSSLDYDYDPDARPPERWLAFLHELFQDDNESIELLQDFFGILLTQDTRQQKALLTVGPRRSGKGTIARVLTSLVGPDNVVAPTVDSLASHFGLQPLQGKSLAIVSDARFHGKGTPTVLERFLCITGEDAITVDRKYRESVTLRLPLRFVFLTNEIPRVSDTSGAFAGRLLILRLTNSFYGSENTNLTRELLTNLPGILLWALDGWRRLQQRGRFIQPRSVQDAIETLEELASPVSAFLEEECLRGPTLRVSTNALYDRWKSWCEAEGRDYVGTKQSLGRDLLAAAPGVVCRRNSGRGRFYEGVTLKPPYRYTE